MKVCPKCKLEYREGFEYCSDCNTKLIDKEKGSMDKSNDIEIEYLMSVSNEIEAGNIEDVLKKNNIPVLKKHKGSGEYVQLYLGISNFGIDMYVPSNFKKIAENIIRENFDAQKYYKENIDEKSKESNGRAAENFDEEVGTYKRKRRKKVWILLIIVNISVILMMLVYLFKYIYNFFIR